MKRNQSGTNGKRNDDVEPDVGENERDDGEDPEGDCEEAVVDGEVEEKKGVRGGAREEEEEPGGEEEEEDDERERVVEEAEEEAKEEDECVVGEEVGQVLGYAGRRVGDGEWEAQCGGV